MVDIHLLPTFSLPSRSSTPEKYRSRNRTLKMPEFTVFRGLPDGSIRKNTTKKPELTGDQVLLKVTASGLCGTGKPECIVASWIIRD